MAKKVKTNAGIKPDVETKADAEPKTGAETVPRKFELSKLRENCLSLFGVSASTFAGATVGMKGRYSVEEMKAHIEDWKKKGVK